MDVFPVKLPGHEQRRTFSWRSAMTCLFTPLPFLIFFCNASTASVSSTCFARLQVSCPCPAPGVCELSSWVGCTQAGDNRSATPNLGVLLGHNAAAALHLHLGGRLQHKDMNMMGHALNAVQPCKGMLCRTVKRTMLNANYNDAYIHQLLHLRFHLLVLVTEWVSGLALVLLHGGVILLVPGMHRILLVPGMHRTIRQPSTVGLVRTLAA